MVRRGSEAALGYWMYHDQEGIFGRQGDVLSGKDTLTGASIHSLRETLSSYLIEYVHWNDGTIGNCEQLVVKPGNLVSTRCTCPCEAK